MARKKQEISLQTEINAQDEWEEILQKEGLLVVDVYQEWCGPCKALVSFFRRMKNEIGDDLLNFAVAKSDTVDALERYRGKCEPCFLFYGGGSLVSVVRGANPPELERAIKDKLKEEHAVMTGEKERIEIRDPAFAYLDEIGRSLPEEDEEVVEVEVTLALIKPDAVAAGKVDEIIQKLEEANIEVLRHEERQLTEDEARNFYSHMSEMEFYDSLISFMASGPSHILVLAKGTEGIISEFRDLLGPPNVEEAKATAPESLRARFGSEYFKNAIHAADSRDSAAKELAFFFPDFVAPKIQKRRARPSAIQRTLALIRPDAYREFKDQILAKITESGFTIAMQREMMLTRDQVEQFYSEHVGQPYFEELVNRMCSGPLLALALARQNAVEGWRNMLGPKDPKVAREESPDSLRSIFSKDDVPINLLHGSDSMESAEKELKLFFPIEPTVVAIKPDAYDNRDEIMEKIMEAGFNIATRKETALTAEMATEFYKELKDKPFFEDLVNHMTSGPTLFLVLTREDAVQGWRKVMGPTDPEAAVDTCPDSLRALYGKNVKENALHGSSNVDQVKRSINLIFGDLDVKEDGTIRGEEQEMESRVMESEERIMLEAEEAETAPKHEETDEAETAEKQAEEETEAPKADGEAHEEEQPKDSNEGEGEHVEAEQKEAEQNEAEPKEAEQNEAEPKEAEQNETETKEAEQNETEPKVAEEGEGGEMHQEEHTQEKPEEEAQATSAGTTSEAMTTDHDEEEKHEATEEHAAEADSGHEQKEHTEHPAGDNPDTAHEEEADRQHGESSGAHGEDVKETPPSQPTEDSPDAEVPEPSTAHAAEAEQEQHVQESGETEEN